MARIKKRQDTTLKVFKFGAQPLEELPQQFWDSAKQSKNVWNEMVEMREALWEQVKDLEKAERIPYYRQFQEDWQAYLKSADVKARLGNDDREYLVEKFDRADKEAKKNKARLRKQFALEKIFFRHRYSGGGKSLHDFKRQRGKGFNFNFPSEFTYFEKGMTHRKKRIGAGAFGVVKDREEVFSFPFSAVIHREIPDNAIVKSVAWTGRRLKNSGFTKSKLPESQRDWTWSFVVTVEVPQPALHTTERSKIVALDVGWRKLDDNFLRIGALRDSAGNDIEVRCPIRHESCNVRYGKLIGGLRELFKLDEEIGDLIQSTKDSLAEKGFKNLLKTRQGGLFRLLNALVKTRDGEFKDERDREFAEKTIEFYAKEASAEKREEAIALLEKFRAEYLPASSKRVRSFTRLNNYRDWLYQNVAAWLAESYDTIIWEGKLNLKKMAEDWKDLNTVETEDEKNKEKRRRLAAKYRSFASIYKFRDYIKKAFEKQGKKVIDGKTAFTTRECSECGTVCEKFADVEMICPNGHILDRDFNATQNLLNQVRDEIKFDAGCRIVIPDAPNRDLSRVLRKRGD